MIVEQFKGRIGFKSGYEAGSTFFYDFETEDFQPTEYKPEKDKKFSLPSFPSLEVQELDLIKNFSFIDVYSKFTNAALRRILVVDDEEFCISTLKIMLKMAGIDLTTQVDFCITGEEAVEHVVKASRHGLRYRLILTDFNMPIMDGIEATRKIRHFLGTNNMQLE